MTAFESEIQLQSRGKCCSVARAEAEIRGQIVAASVFVPAFGRGTQWLSVDRVSTNP
jgi:hypothetical protein